MSAVSTSYRMYCSTIVLVQLAWFWRLSVPLISFDADAYQWSITLLIEYYLIDWLSYPVPGCCLGFGRETFQPFFKKNISATCFG